MLEDACVTYSNLNAIIVSGRRSPKLLSLYTTANARCPCIHRLFGGQKLVLGKMLLKQDYHCERRHSKFVYCIEILVALSIRPLFCGILARVNLWSCDEVIVCSHDSLDSLLGCTGTWV